MSRILLALAALGTLVVAGCRATHSASHVEGPRAQITHDVFFTLKPDHADQVDALVAGCLGLRAIPGVVHLTAGQRDPAWAAPVNDVEYHVGLHVEFADAAAYEGYLPHPLHEAFVAEFGPGFERVVVYDTRLEE